MFRQGRFPTGEKNVRKCGQGGIAGRISRTEFFDGCSRISECDFIADMSERNSGRRPRNKVEYCENSSERRRRELEKRERGINSCPRFSFLYPLSFLSILLRMFLPLPILFPCLVTSSSVSCSFLPLSYSSSLLITPSFQIPVPSLFFFLISL